MIARFVAGSFREAWRRRWRTHLALASTWVLLAALVIGGGGNRSGTAGFGTASWSAYLFTQFPAIARYLRLVFWPHPLVFDYATFWVAHPLQVLPQALLALSLFAGTLWALRFRPAVGFLGACFFLILAPTSLVPGTSQMIVESVECTCRWPRFSVSWLSSPTLRSATGASFWPPPSSLPPDWPASPSAAMRCTRPTSPFGPTPWRKVPRTPVARDLLGLAFREIGRTGEAIAQYQEALRLKPVFAEAHNNLGIALDETGRAADAIPHYQEALRIKPDYAEAHNNLGLALEELGRIPEAIIPFQEALRLAPDDSRVHFKPRLRLPRNGSNRMQAIVQFQRALEIKPAYADAHANLGLALQERGQASAALVQLQEALRLEPDNPRFHFNLGLVLDGTGRTTEAIAAYQEALRLKPSFAEASNNLGVALRKSGRIEEAIVRFQEALQAKPAFAEADNNLGLAFGATGRIAEAIESFRRASRLAPDDADIHTNLAMALRAAG